MIAATGIAIAGLIAFVPARQTGHQPAGEERPIVIRLNAVAGLQYDRVRFSVKPGAVVRLVLANQDDMSHNMVITRPGRRESVVTAAMKLEEKGPSMNYIPEGPDVLWSIPVLAPGEEQSVTFTVPAERGVYPYVCTFPGHGFVMYGAMYVTTEGRMPELATDEHIPPQRRAESELGGHAGHTAHADAPRVHPYAPTPPYLYRAYMSDASPAAIAVHLPHQLSYCWDAETCELRYAWEGAFVDNTGLWKGKPNAEAKVLGTIFYRNKVKQPLRLNGRENRAVEFRGYRLVNRYPEFHYRLDGQDVYELVHPAEDRKGLIRTFRIPKAREAVWFITDASDGMIYTSTAGQWRNNTLHVPLAEAGAFSITMTKKEGR